MTTIPSKLNHFDPIDSAKVWAIAPRDLLASKTNRLAYVDLMRGWMICLVVIAHCFGQASLDESSWIASLNPTGWATKVFVMLTGFSALIILGADRPANARRIYRRAAQVAMIALVSNVLSIILTRGSLGAGLDSLSFRLPWTISQFLIPTSIILAASPMVAWLCRRYGAGMVVIGSVATWFGSDWIGWYWAESLDGVARLALVGNDIISLPLLHYVLAGISVQAMAAWLVGMAQSGDLSRLKKFSFTAVSLGGAILIGDGLWDAWIGELDHVINPAIALSRFVVFMHLSLWISRAAVRGSAWADGLAQFIGPIGRSALLIFVGHRPVVHAVGALVQDWGRFDLAKLLIMIIWVFVILQFGLWMRSQWPRLDRRLTSIGL
jgi:hypothetical protein